MSIGGGLRYPGATVEEPSIFTLYGDGRAIYTTRALTNPDTTGRSDLWQAKLTPDQVASLLEFALVTSGLAVARGHYNGEIPVADAPTTTFEARVGNAIKTVSVYYLDYTEEPVPDAEARRRFGGLAEELMQFDERVQSGEVESFGAFEPQAYLLTLDSPFGPEQPARAWPWDDLKLVDFSVEQGGLRTTAIDAAQAKRLADPINSVSDNLVLAAPDGTSHLVRIRPLLPDQLP